MEYNYVPNSYDKNLISKNEFLQDNFLLMQIKYRQSIEEVLKSIINFKELDDYCTKEIKVPINDDWEDNFYHKFSTLNSKYIFLRNNIHVEKLKNEDIEKIKRAIFNENLLDKEFVLRTLKDVLYEDGDYVFYGVAMDENRVDSQSLVFEFSYDDSKCSIEEGILIKKICDNILNNIKERIESNLNCHVELIINKGFANINNINKGL